MMISRGLDNATLHRPLLALCARALVDVSPEIASAMMMISIALKGCRGLRKR